MSSAASIGSSAVPLKSKTPGVRRAHEAFSSVNLELEYLNGCAWHESDTVLGGHEQGARHPCPGRRSPRLQTSPDLCSAANKIIISIDHWVAGVAELAVPGKKK